MYYDPFNPFKKILPPVHICQCEKCPCCGGYIPNMSVGMTSPFTTTTESERREND